MTYYPELDEIYDIDRQWEEDEAKRELEEEVLQYMKEKLINAVRQTDGEELNEDDILKLSDDDLKLVYFHWFPPKK